MEETPRTNMKSQKKRLHKIQKKNSNTHAGTHARTHKGHAAALIRLPRGQILILTNHSSNLCT